MKKLIAFGFILFFINSVAQENNSLNELNLKGNVSKVAESSYTYDPEVEKYVLLTYSEMDFSEGLLQQSVDYDDLFGENITSIFVYDNKKLNFVLHLSDLTDDSTIIAYEYSGQLPVKRWEISFDSKSTAYEYDGNGNLVKEKEMKENGEILRQSQYEGIVKSGNYKVVSNAFDGDKVINNMVKQFQNGKLVQMDFESQFSSENKTFEYDKQGNMLTETNGGNVVAKYFYVYDSNGNYTNLVEARNDEDVFAIQGNVFYFREITYQTGDVSGSINFDAEFVRKFDPDSKSYEVYISEE